MKTAVWIIGYVVIWAAAMAVYFGLAATAGTLVAALIGFPFAYFAGYYGSAALYAITTRS